MRAIFVVLLALIVSLSACTAPEAGEIAQPQGESATEEDAVSAPSDGELDPMTTELMKLFEAQGNLEYKVSYDITWTSEGESIVSKSTEYFDGPKKIRTDVTAMGIESRNYVLGEVMTSCTKYSTSWTCNKIDTSVPVEEDYTQSTEEWESDFTEEPDKFTVKEDGTITVAGETGKCFKMSSDTNPATTRYCFSREGVPLLVRFDSPDGSNEMRATAFSRSVSASDFDLPAGAKVTEGYDTGISEDADPDCVMACAEIEDLGEMMECTQAC